MNIEQLVRKIDITLFILFSSSFKRMFKKMLMLFADINVKHVQNDDENYACS